VTRFGLHRASIVLRFHATSAALALLFLTPAASAQEEAPAGDGRRTVAQLPANLLRATVGVFSRTNVSPLLVGSATTAASGLFDDAIADALADDANDFSQTMQTGSEPVWTATALGAVFVVGRFTHSPPFRSVTYDWLDAWAVTAGYTTLLKNVVGRERPNGSNHRSFPSGHTSNAFALAVVAERHFGWKVGLPAYGVATLVGASLPARAQLTVSPVLARRTRLLVVRVSF
jgi:hypothetical protein